MYRKKNTQTPRVPSTESNSKENKSLSVNYQGDIYEYCVQNIREVNLLISNKISKQCTKYNLTREELEDIKQECFLFLFCRIKQYNHEKSCVSTFIENLLDSFIFNRVKKIKRYKVNMRKFHDKASPVSLLPEEESRIEFPPFHGLNKLIAEQLSLGLLKKDVASNLGIDESTVLFHIKDMKDLIEYRKKCLN